MRSSASLSKRIIIKTERGKHGYESKHKVTVRAEKEQNHTHLLRLAACWDHSEDGCVT